MQPPTSTEKTAARQRLRHSRSPKLFGKLERKLVKSYLTEAIDIPRAKDLVVPTAKEVQAFMADVDQVAAQRSFDTKAARTQMKKGMFSSGSSVDFDEAFGDVKGGLIGGKPKPAPTVYKNYQAN